MWAVLLILLLVSLSYITTFTALLWSLIQPTNIDFESWGKPDPELVVVTTPHFECLMETGAMWNAMHACA